MEEVQSESKPDMAAGLSSRQPSEKLSRPSKRAKALTSLKATQSQQRPAKSPKKRKQQAAETAQPILPQALPQQVIKTRERLRSPKKASKSRFGIAGIQSGSDQARVDETAVRPRKIAKKENASYKPEPGREEVLKASLYDFEDCIDKT